ncbi:MAG: preprotein translocase subunit SecE [Desulfobacterales bacterium]|nr:preprotein translocase subunit SecE [Desulfobacterales bacterium]
MFGKIKGFIDNIGKYLKSVKSEMKRITWPTPTELRSYTVVVILVLAVISTYLWLVDNILAQAFLRMYKQLGN